MAPESEPASRLRRHGGGDFARGAPDGIVAFLFDLDGVLTQTAKVHAAAWKKMFDAFLRARAEDSGKPIRTVRDCSRLRAVCRWQAARGWGPRFPGVAGDRVTGGQSGRRNGPGDRPRPGNAQERPGARLDRGARGRGLQGLRPIRGGGSGCAASGEPSSRRARTVRPSCGCRDRGPLRGAG